MGRVLAFFWLSMLKANMRSLKRDKFLFLVHFFFVLTPFSLDGDNVLEILFSGHDGRLHCFWADGTEKYNWPVQAGDSSQMRMFNAPIVVGMLVEFPRRYNFSSVSPFDLLRDLFNFFPFSFSSDFT